MLQGRGEDKRLKKVNAQEAIESTFLAHRSSRRSRRIVFQRAIKRLEVGK